MQTEHKLYSGKDFRGKQIPQIPDVNERLLDDIGFQKSIPFFSGTSSTTRKHSRNLEPFFPSERPHASTLNGNFSIHVTVNWYNTTIFTLKWELLTQNTECTERIMAIKKGLNHSNNNEKCFGRNLDDLLCRWSPEFFAGFFTQLHKLRSLRGSFLHFQCLLY